MCLRTTADLPMINHLAFLGFGEAASAFAKGWESVRPDNVGARVTAFDIKTDSDASRAQKLADYKTAGVAGHMQLEGALAEAEVIFSLVTADQAGITAKAASVFIKPGQYYFDCNSCSPDTKRANAQLVESAGGLYVDVAVMAPVYPALHQTPLLISGAHAEDALEIFSALDMKASVVEGEVGASSSIKMIRSIMIKGLEALNAECLLAARKAGVDQTILASLDKSFPGFEWQTRSAYMLERMMVHGVRRAAEMREVALTVEQLGLNNAMAQATVQWQQQIGELDLQPGSEEFGSLADSILQRV